MSATVQDISRKARCSPATVSRVINSTGPVSNTVRNRVLKAMQEEGYVPRRATAGRSALRPSARATDIVQVVFCRNDAYERITMNDQGFEVAPLEAASTQSLRSPDHRLANAFYQHMLDGALAELGEWKLQAMIRTTSDLLDPQLLADANAPDRRGTILLGNFVSTLEPFIDACQGNVVIIDSEYRGWPDVVAIDHADGISRTTRHLLELGHRDIGYLGGSLENNGNVMRCNAFLAEMKSAGVAVREEWLSHGTNHVEETSVRAEALLRRSSRPTALVCFNDFIALAALRAAGRVGLNVPRDLSVVGFDDIDIAGFMTPPLTTVRVPTEELGRHAVRQLLVRHAAGGDPRQRRGCELRVWTDLVVRESTAPPPTR